MPAQLTHRDGEVVLRAEADIRARLGHLPLDFTALQAVSNIYRAATAVRNQIEREILGDVGLSWGGFTILFVLWIWGPMQAHALADECGLAKGTLTGMVGTLEKRSLVERVRLDDRRRVQVALTDRGRVLMEEVFPAFNKLESRVVAGLDDDEVSQLSRLLCKVTGFD
jgi:DNA-binding MarR family transcriptional regulator